MSISVEKFMKTMGIIPKIEIEKSYFNQGTHFLCLKVFASYEGVIEYLENFCFYYVKRDDEAYLSDSIIHLSINDGIFKYLGDKVEVEDYFYYKAMEFALEHFRKQNI
jgi:hypothetical protein